VAPEENVDTRSSELRLFLEEVSCDLCRYRHAVDGVRPEDVRIHQEVFLGLPGAFADIKVTVPGAAPYFVEVKYGYPPEKVVRHLERKFGAATPGGRDAAKLVLVIDSAPSANWPAAEREIRRRIRPELALEIWDESMLLSLLRSQFGLSIDRLTEITPTEFHAAIDRAKGVEAFAESFVNDPLQAALLWHFGSWVLRRVREESGASARAVLPPGRYKNVAAVFADLSSFSSYVRDTRDDQVVRHVLTFFYSKSRYQVLNSGGMLYQFLGDGMVALFGVVGRRPSYVEDALQCATALLEIGRSTSNEWQRRIDHVQTGGGCHIGMAIGDLNIVSLRPFSRSHVGAIADSINTAARLSAAAGPDEIVAANALFHDLSTESQSRFAEIEAIDARNVGRIRAWKVRDARWGSL
jgi:adenylate cyclase